MYLKFNRFCYYQENQLFHVLYEKKNITVFYAICSQHEIFATILNAPLSLCVTVIKFPLSDFKLSFLCKLKSMQLQQFYERPTFENKVMHELTWCICYSQL